MRSRVNFAGDAPGETRWFMASGELVRGSGSWVVASRSWCSRLAMAAAWLWHEFWTASRASCRSVLQPIGFLFLSLVQVRPLLQMIQAQTIIEGFQFLFPVDLTLLQGIGVILLVQVPLFFELGLGFGQLRLEFSTRGSYFSEALLISWSRVLIRISASSSRSLAAASSSRSSKCSRCCWVVAASL